ncbi:MAG: LemA family protein [Lachnospiraceae bacterium]|nr:LemA family protein [Lachnospiraceae bacterium]
MIKLFLLLALIAIAVIWSISTINKFKKCEIKVTESLSGIEVALTKRFDMLTKLLDASKGYMAHEKDLFTQIIAMRQGMSLAELGEAEQRMTEVSGQLFAVAENYPELRSSEVFVELQRGIRDAEEHLQAARRVYNANVTAYNTKIAVFPDKLLAGSRVPKEFYKADEAKRADVKMTF